MRDDAAIEREALEARLAEMGEELATARTQVAAFALALDVLGRGDSALGPTAVADAVVQLFATLFAPGEVRLSLVEPGTQALRHGSAAPAGEAVPAFVPSEDGRGFRVRLVHEGRLVGMVDVGQLALPAYRDRYENTALVIAPVAATLLVHARSLHGLIAICAYCKRIRDGHGTWHVLEEYLTEHSEALFSHGVCPTCIKAASVVHEDPDFEAPPDASGSG